MAANGASERLQANTAQLGLSAWAICAIPVAVVVHHIVFQKKALISRKWALLPVCLAGACLLWLRAVSRAVPEPYLVGPSHFGEETTLNSQRKRMKCFTYHRLKGTAEEDSVIGTTRSPRLRDCKLHFMEVSLHKMLNQPDICSRSFFHRLLSSLACNTRMAAMRPVYAPSTLSACSSWLAWPFSAAVKLKLASIKHTL